MKLKMVICVIAISLAGCAFAQQPLDIHIASVEEVFNPNDLIHYSAMNHKAGDEIAVTFWRDSDNKILHTQNVKVYAYAGDWPFDVKVPKVKPGYYHYSWENHSAAKLHVEKPWKKK